MLTSIKNFIISRRVSRLHKVANKYLFVLQSMFDIAIPNALSFYEDVSETLIDKTAENPQPLVNLLTAVEECIKHYGPGLKKDVARYEASFTSNDEAKIKARMDSLCQAVLDLQRDVH